jgi:hypothetical protein
MNSQKKQASVNGESEIVNSFFILEEATSSPGKDIQLPARQFLIFFSHLGPLLHMCVVK